MPGLRVQAIVVRASKPYWSFEPASGEGAAKYGGRFNPVGMSALYTSFSFNTCAREVKFSLNADPYTFYFLEVDCTDIADLMDKSVRADLNISESDLECPNWESEMYAGLEPASHKIARELMDAGYAGMKVRSFAKGAGEDDINLTLWRWNDITESGLESVHAVRVLKRDELPRDNKSWSLKSE